MHMFLTCFSGRLPIGMRHFQPLKRGSARQFFVSCLPTGMLDFKPLQEEGRYKYTKLSPRNPNLMSFILFYISKSHSVLQGAVLLVALRRKTTRPK
jgi:hypothetical protein